MDKLNIQNIVQIVLLVMLVGILIFAFTYKEMNLINQILTAILAGLNLSALVATNK